MKNFIIIILIGLSFTCNGQNRFDKLFREADKAARLIELSLNNEDKAIGLSYIDVKNHFIIGAENGLYKYDRAKVEHQKYKAGYSLLMEKVLNGQNNLIWTASACYNRYNVIYNYDQVKHMPKFSFELSVRTNFTDRVYVGVQWDIIRHTGGFNISYVIFK